ncbi:uncharacterized protein zgc:193505 [Pygocentrus nattereri]|uniref:uncharacterized protein zgc:193505 n=1 Tax=Pygocentrus nattereri TaxID=42514 RepID=UPI00189125A4|nr:uncharacterized protein zgc:193505 [Pygocentrus nattereri]
MSLNHFVDAAVDKAASVAKVKVKSMFGGGDGKSKSGGGKSGGGIGGLFPSSGDGGDKSNKGEKAKGGLFDVLKSPPMEEPKDKASGGAENTDFNSAIDELSGL